METLILGYGNVDRQDDGVAWYILAEVGRQLGLPIPSSVEEEFPVTDGNIQLQFLLQLTPELSETIAGCDRVCFVDAHMGHVSNDVNIETVISEFQASPFTHHLTAATCLSLAQALYGKAPPSVLVSVRGYEFGFSRALSPRTKALALEAAEEICKWLN
jgi:hydrogenase maturation protease